MATKKQVKKVAKVMREYKAGMLHSGSKKGPKVTSRKQAVAIAMSEAKMSRSAKTKKRVEKTHPKRHERTESKRERRMEYGK
jgi:hypothetical protein